MLNHENFFNFRQSASPVIPDTFGLNIDAFLNTPRSLIKESSPLQGEVIQKNDRQIVVTQYEDCDTNFSTFDISFFTVGYEPYGRSGFYCSLAYYGPDNSHFEFETAPFNIDSSLQETAAEGAQEPPVKPKQVILVHTDTIMDGGKIGAQMAHACLKVFFDRGTTVKYADGSGVMTIPMTREMITWSEGEYTKIALGVASEEQLRNKHQQAVDAGLPTAFIIDNGHTVFDGVKTPTTCAIGPADPNEIDAITKRLRLLKLPISRD